MMYRSSPPLPSHSPPKTLRNAFELFYNYFVVARLCSQKKKALSPFNFISYLHIIKHYFKDMYFNGCMIYHNLCNQFPTFG